MMAIISSEMFPITKSYVFYTEVYNGMSVMCVLWLNLLKVFVAVIAWVQTYIACYDEYSGFLLKGRDQCPML